MAEYPEFICLRFPAWSIRVGTFLLVFLSTFISCAGPNPTQIKNSLSDEFEFLGDGSPERKKEKGIPYVKTFYGWLYNSHGEDGSWKTLSGQADIRITAIAALVFLGKGNSLFLGDRKGTLQASIHWLLLHQNETGQLRDQTPADFWGQTLATTALLVTVQNTLAGVSYYKPNKPVSLPIEARNGSWLPPLLNRTQKALNFLLAMPAATKIWDRTKPDTPHLNHQRAWFAFCMELARKGGHRIPPEQLTKVTCWLKGKALSEPTTGLEAATRLVCRFFLGKVDRSDPTLKNEIDWLVNNPPSMPSETTDLQYWFLGAMVLARYGRNSEHPWQRSMGKFIVFQVKKNDGLSKKESLMGSWDPVGKKGKELGRAYSTAMNSLCCQFYYKFCHLIPHLYLQGK